MSFWDEHAIQSGRIACLEGEVWFHVTEDLDNCPGCGEHVPESCDTLGRADA